MSSNAIGTLFRIIVILSLIILIWLLPIAVFYYLTCLVLDIEFSFKGVFVVFGFVVTFRAFYPKNVFKG